MIDSRRWFLLVLALSLAVSVLPAQADPRDSTRSVERPAAASEQAPPLPAAAGIGETTTPAMATPEVLLACRQLQGTKLLRIDGPFGRFVGHAARIGPESLEGLRAWPEMPGSTTPGSLTWEQVDGVDTQASRSGRGALVGGTVLGTAAGLLGLAVGADLSSQTDHGARGLVFGFGLGFGAVGFGAGALVGAVVGAALPSWHRVYRRPGGVRAR